MQFHERQFASLGSLIAHDDAQPIAADGAVGDEDVWRMSDEFEENPHGPGGQMVVVESQASHFAHHVFQQSAPAVQLCGETDASRQRFYLAVGKLLTHGQGLSIRLSDGSQFVVAQNQILQLLTAA